MSRSFEQQFTLFSRLAAAAVPLSLSILNAAGDPYWLDSPEFTAAAVSLGIPHPPGHPLYVMLTRPFTLLPVGTIGLRVSLASAVASAAAVWLLFEMTLLVVKKMTLSVPPWIHPVVALGASLLAFINHGWWFQSVRQEVYGLQVLLVFAALFPVIRYTFTEAPDRDARLLHLSAFFFGLGLANHHFIMLVALPAAIPALVRAARSDGPAPFPHYLRLVAATATGLLAYLFLPARSLAGAPVALGGVHSISDFIWVVTARVYQKSMTRESALYLQDTPSDAIFSIMGELGPVVVVAALAGFYLLLRRRSTRLAGITLALAACVTLFLRMLMGFDPFNPDYYGYVLPTIGITAAAAGLFAAVVLHVLYRTVASARFIGPVLAAAIFLVPVWKGRSTVHSTDLSSFHATRDAFDAALSDAPDHTVVIAGYYKLFFMLWSPGFIDGSRPDIHVINPQFFGYPGYLASVARRTPEIKELAWSIFVKNAITERAVASLASRGPLRVDPSTWTGDEALRHLIPDGLLYLAFPAAVSTTELATSVPRHEDRWRRLYHSLGTGWKEHETWRFLCWQHYQDAVFFSRAGERDAARAAVARSIALGAATPQINALEDALRKDEKGPLDVTPFLLQPPPGEAP